MVQHESRVVCEARLRARSRFPTNVRESHRRAVVVAENREVKAKWLNGTLPRGADAEKLEDLAGPLARQMLTGLIGGGLLKGADQLLGVKGAAGQAVAHIDFDKHTSVL